MGQAKQRGTREERVAQALQRESDKWAFRQAEGRIHRGQQLAASVPDTQFYNTQLAHTQHDNSAVVLGVGSEPGNIVRQAIAEHGGVSIVPDVETINDLHRTTLRSRLSIGRTHSMAAVMLARMNIPKDKP
jgi:hypothetical protein